MHQLILMCIYTCIYKCVYMYMNMYIPVQARLDWCHAWSMVFSHNFLLNHQLKYGIDLEAYLKKGNPKGKDTASPVQDLNNLSDRISFIAIAIGCPFHFKVNWFISAKVHIFIGYISSLVGHNHQCCCRSTLTSCRMPKICLLKPSSLVGTKCPWIFWGHFSVMSNSPCLE